MIRRFFPSGFRRHAPGLGAHACSPLVIGAALVLAVPAGAAQQAGAVDDDTAEPAASTSIPVVQPTAPSPTRMLNAALARLARDPRDMGALLDAGGAALDLGDTDAAIGFLSRAEQVSPGNAGVRARIGIAMLRANQPFEAIRWFDLADQAGFNRAEMATERGLAYDLAGDNTAAQRQYQLAISGLPKESAQSDEAIRRYALSLVIAGDRRGAELLIQPLLERRDRGAWRVRTFIMAIAGQSDEAEGIARATMPADLASAISPYLRYMPRLTPAQQAAAANLGRFPRAADIGRDDPQVMQYALAHPRAPRVDAGLVPQGEALGARGRDDRDSRAKRRRPGKDGARETAIAAAAPQTALQPATPPPPSAPAVSAPWGLQPGTRTAAAAATQSAPQPAQTQPVPQPVPQPMPQVVQSARPTVLSKLDVPPGTPLAPSPVPTARAAAPVSAPPAPLVAAPTAQASPPLAQTLQTSNPTPVPAPLAPTPSAPAASAPAVSSPPALVPAQVQVAAMAGVAPSGASAALTPPPPAAASVPLAAQPTPPSPVQAPDQAPVQAAATAPADFRSIFDGFKPPEQETATSTEAVDLARIEAMRQAARAEAAKSRADKGGDRGKDRGERPDGPTSVSRTNGEDPAATRAARDKASKEAAAKEAEAKAASAKSARDKLALDRACLDKAGNGKGASGKGASAKSSGAKGKASSKSGAGKGKGKGSSDTQCPPANDKSQKGKKAKAEAANPSRIWVQVLTGSNRSAMGKEWQRLTGQAAALRGRKPLISPWRNNFRLLTGPFGSDAEAQAFVEKLRKEGVSGFQFTSPAGQAVDGLGAK